jgi:hypothetical protein
LVTIYIVSSRTYLYIQVTSMPTKIRLITGIHTLITFHVNYSVENDTEELKCQKNEHEYKILSQRNQIVQL